MNPLLSIMISDISRIYSLRNARSHSGEYASEIVVKPSISEKNMLIRFFSPSSFIFHSPERISWAISFETYSQRALLSFHFSLFSTRYLTRFEEVSDIMSAKISSVGKLMTMFVKMIKTVGTMRRNIIMIDILLSIRTKEERLKLKYTETMISENMRSHSSDVLK
jgi:hypothetical protein